MTLPQWAPPRKPRRLGLYLPFLLLALFAIAWSAAWVWLSGAAARRMDAARAAGATSGWRVDWRTRSISGFPFRLDVNLTGARVREGSGWGLTAPVLKAEAFVFAPAHWVAYAPAGAVLKRRRGGALVITAKALRGSLSDWSASPPRLSLEGLGLTFVTPAGAAPFLLSSAAEFHLHAKAGPNGQGAAYVEIDGARANVSGLVGRIADGKPVALTADAIFDHAGALRGANWPAAARAWRVAGGALTVRTLRVVAGSAQLDSRAGTLTIGADGRLRGKLDLALREAPRTLAAMGAEGSLAPDAARAASTVVGVSQSGPLARLPLTFEAGRATLGPVALGPAPRVY